MTILRSAESEPTSNERSPSLGLTLPTEPVIVEDTRERPGMGWRFDGLNVVRGTLKTGDYSLRGFEDRIALERKEFSDYINSLTFGRGRFERELERLSCFARAAIIVEADLSDVIEWRYQSRVSPKCVVGSIGSFFGRYNVPTIFAGSKRNAEIIALSMLLKAHKHLGAEAA